LEHRKRGEGERRRWGRWGRLSREKKPMCVVWTWLPPLSFLTPLVGHVASLIVNLKINMKKKKRKKKKVF